MEFLEPLLIALSTLLLLFVALNILIKKKPMVFHSKWIGVHIFLTMGSNMVSDLFTSLQSPSYQQDIWVANLAFLILIVVTFYFLKGYAIFGANTFDLQTAILLFLEEKDYTYTQKLSSIIVKEPDMELRLDIKAKVGTGNIQLKKGKHPLVFAELIQHLRHSKIKSNNTVAYLSLGASMFFAYLCYSNITYILLKLSY